MAYKRSRHAFEADLQAQQSPFAFYGTPLPPLDPSVRDDGSYVPVWKQEVTDDRGRKRLHGAFTGGFSAGYFNTVGSKEGWTPATFTSSRTDRAKDRKDAVQQQAEDFMDEEDLADQAESQKLHTTGGFAGLGSTEAESHARDGLMGLFRPPGSSIGVKLLQRMGWREGQGVGPKVRRRAKGDEDDGLTQETHLFAPDNSPMITFLKKKDTKGLGLSRQSAISRPSPFAPADEGSDDDGGSFRNLSLGRTKAPPTKPTKKSGFGVGILNDTGSDEEDPYEIGPKISYNRVIGDKSTKKKIVNRANPLLAERPVFISKKANARKAVSGFRKCHDGKFPIEGFVLSTISESNFASYPPPEIPTDWRSSRNGSTIEAKASSFASTADAAKASSLDPASRAALLGEASLPGKSVFDFLSSAARDRIAAASGKQNLPAALNEAPPEAFRKTEEQKVKDLWSLVPILDKDLAAASLSRGGSGWMPYAEDSAKRARYRSFLSLRAGLSDKLPERASQTSVEDWVRELQEFAHAAKVFKPMTGMMASRFTSSSSNTQGSTSEDTPLLSRPAAKPEDPAEAAAKLGMFGPMTRSVENFYPTRLVCKRFNVPPPINADPGSAPGEDAHGSAAEKQRLELVNKHKIDEMLMQARFSSGGFEGKSEGQKESGGGAAEVPKQEVVDVERNEALEGQRAGEAVFKAIFGSDSEDEDDSIGGR